MSKALVANNKGSKNSTSQTSKGKGKNKKWKTNTQEDIEKKHRHQINKASLPQIQTRKGKTIRRRKSVAIAKN